MVRLCIVLQQNPSEDERVSAVKYTKLDMAKKLVCMSSCNATADARMTITDAGTGTALNGSRDVATDAHKNHAY